MILVGFLSFHKYSVSQTIVVFFSKYYNFFAIVLYVEKCNNPARSRAGLALLFNYIHQAFELLSVIQQTSNFIFYK